MNGARQIRIGCVGHLFKEEPKQWGLRGDRFLWRELGLNLANMELPATVPELKRILESAFWNATRESLAFCDEFYIDRFSHGGMSSGYICGEFWRTKGFPLVIDRFCAVGCFSNKDEGTGGMKEFDRKTAEEIGFYVYALIDPRTERPFYVGKGKGNRVFAHARDALEDTHAADRLDTIREIINSGQLVDYVIVQHGLKEETAFAVETALIDFAGRFDLGLTNIILGHKSSAFGIMTAGELMRKYRAEPLKSLGDGCVIININRSYRRAKGTKSFYEATKESWVINEKRIPTLKYVLSEYGGFIVEVFEVDEGGWYQVKDSNGKMRWGFSGKQASDEVRDLYLNRSIVKKRGASNPVTYHLSS